MRRRKEKEEGTCFVLGGVFLFCFGQWTTPVIPLSRFFLSLLACVRACACAWERERGKNIFFLYCGSFFPLFFFSGKDKENPHRKKKKKEANVVFLFCT
jgi:hypothetical protein